jgi:hypothetical protein
MFSKFQISVSRHGNITDIGPKSDNEGNDHFIVIDAHGSSVAMSCEIAIAGLLVCAKARGLSLRSYTESLTELDKNEETKPEQKKEEPNVTSIKE